MPRRWLTLYNLTDLNRDIDNDLFPKEIYSFRIDFRLKISGCGNTEKKREISRINVWVCGDSTYVLPCGTYYNAMVQYHNSYQCKNHITHNINYFYLGILQHREAHRHPNDY